MEYCRALVDELCRELHNVALPPDVRLSITRLCTAEKGAQAVELLRALERAIPQQRRPTTAPAFTRSNSFQNRPVDQNRPERTHSAEYNRPVSGGSNRPISAGSSRPGSAGAGRPESARRISVPAGPLESVSEEAASNGQLNQRAQHDSESDRYSEDDFVVEEDESDASQWDELDQMTCSQLPRCQPEEWSGTVRMSTAELEPQSPSTDGSEPESVPQVASIVPRPQVVTQRSLPQRSTSTLDKKESAPWQATKRPWHRKRPASAVRATDNEALGALHHQLTVAARASSANSLRQSAVDMKQPRSRTRPSSAVLAQSWRDARASVCQKRPQSSGPTNGTRRLRHSAYGQRTEDSSGVLKAWRKPTPSGTYGVTPSTMKALKAAKLIAPTGGRGKTTKATYEYIPPQDPLLASQNPSSPEGAPIQHYKARLARSGGNGSTSR